MRVVSLHFQKVSTIVGNDEIEILTLVTDDGTRQINITGDNPALFQFSLRLSGVKDATNLLPEVLLRLLRRHSDEKNEKRINRIKDDCYDVELREETTGSVFPMYGCEAILLSYVSKGQIPIYMDFDLFMCQSMPVEQGSNLAVPLNTLDCKLLQVELGKAIETENYALASLLRDEINRRTK